MLVVHYLPYNLELPLLSNVPHCCRPEEVLTNEGILGGKKVFICVLYVRALTGAVQKSGRYRTTDQHNIKAVRGGLGQHVGPQKNHSHTITTMVILGLIVLEYSKLRCSIGRV